MVPVAAVLWIRISIHLAVLDKNPDPYWDAYPDGNGNADPDPGA
jgi:hypothetical protein